MAVARGGVPAGICPTLGLVPYPAPGDGFSWARGGCAARGRKGGSVGLRFYGLLGVTFLSAHAELQLSASAPK